jgi:hypothetical protein
MYVCILTIAFAIYLNVICCDANKERIKNLRKGFDSNKQYT